MNPIVKSLRKRLYNRNMAMFLVFLLLALFVWFMHKLSHDYLYTVEYPVELYSTTNRQLVFEEANTKLSVQLKMSGFSILKAKLTLAPTLHLGIDEDKYAKVGSQRNTYYVLSNNLTEIIATQLGGEQKVVALSPDTITFKIRKLAEKKVPVRHQLTLNLEQEYMLKGSIALTPDSIVVSGSRAAIDTITGVSTFPKTLNKLVAPIEGQLSLQAIEGVRFSHTKVGFHADIVRYTEGCLKVPLQVQNLPATINLILLPSEVEVKYRAAVSDFTSVDPSLFILAVSYGDVKDETTKTMKINVVQKPEKVLAISLSPPFVEFIIRKD